MRTRLNPIRRVFLVVCTVLALVMPVANSYAAQATMLVRAEIIVAPQAHQAADTAYVFEADNSNLKIYL